MPNNDLSFWDRRKGYSKEPLPPRVSVCHDRSEVEAAVTRPTKRVTWISFSRNFTDILLEKVVVPAPIFADRI